MASLQNYTFSQLVSNIATAVQGAASSLVDFTVGSVLRAIAEATSAVILWLQAIILQILTLTRAATSVGQDLDSWMADFGLSRLPASASTGSVTFSRFTATQQALIPIGATVQSADGTQTFAVTLDTTNSAYNAGLGGYVIAANASSVTVPVQDTVPGSGGNVQSNAIAVITTPIPGVDTVANASAFTNGIDAETDAAFRSRFVLYLASLSKATNAAVAFAIASVQQGLDYTLTENENYAGSSQPGYFYVVVDDGSGSPSTDLLDRIAAAINEIRGLTINFGVFAPVDLTANITMVLTTAAGYVHNTVIAAVTTALQNFINGLTVGTSLPYTQLSSIAYGVPGVENVTGILLNGTTSDLTADNQHKILAGTFTIS
jgi:uncharacterized phage protein gp47/JayE